MGKDMRIAVRVTAKEKEKDEVKTHNEIEIVEKLGEGGQGVVYKVKHDGKLRALKWYFPGKLQDEAAFIKNLENNINNYKRNGR